MSGALGEDMALGRGGGKGGGVGGGGAGGWEERGRRQAVESVEECEYWCEVFLEGEGDERQPGGGEGKGGGIGDASGAGNSEGGRGKWIHVDVTNDVINNPFCYWDNGVSMSYVAAYTEREVTDVTRRYVRDWVVTQQQRDPSAWWQETLEKVSFQIRGHQYFSASDVQQTFADQSEMAHIASQEPLPTSLGAFKKHHLYCIEKHLLRNEVIYPKTKLAGMVNGEKVYFRTNVREVKTIANWFRQYPPRSVRALELPCPAKKMKKSTRGGKDSSSRGRGGRSGKGKGKEPMEEDEEEGREGGEDEEDEEGERDGQREGGGGGGKEACLYGEWQTDLYEPPAVVNGIVPKNDKGSWEMWTTAHLPRGAAHVKLRGAANIARKLGLDFSPALIGFEVGPSRI